MYMYVYVITGMYCIAGNFRSEKAFANRQNVEFRGLPIGTVG